MKEVVFSSQSSCPGLNGVVNLIEDEVKSELGT